MSERVTMFCSVKCDCGQTHGATLGHYDRVEGSCGKIYWALQPRRNGPFVLFSWPGFPGLTISQSASMLSYRKPTAGVVS